MVEAHLASCPRCREVLAELKTLAVGVATLPKMQPPPRFLAEVRRKIARGDNPEALTWRDYLFRPFWIKVPLELAAVVAVAFLVMRLRQQAPVETVASDQLAQAENSGNDQLPSPDMEAKSEQPAATESAPAPQSRPPVAAPENEAATVPQANPRRRKNRRPRRRMGRRRISGNCCVRSPVWKLTNAERAGQVGSHSERRRHQTGP